MENKTIKTKNLRLARLKHFDWTRNGVELTDVEAYAFLMKVGDQYINVFDLTENYAVYDRSIYPNVRDNGEEFGYRLIHVSGQEDTGPCYVIEPVKVDTLIGTDAISLNGLKEYVYRSEKFFVDRFHLMEEERGSRRIKMIPTMRADQKKMGVLKAYLAAHEGAKQYIK